MSECCCRALLVCPECVVHGNPRWKMGHACLPFHVQIRSALMAKPSTALVRYCDRPQQWSARRRELFTEFMADWYKENVVPLLRELHKESPVTRLFR